MVEEFVVYCQYFQPKTLPEAIETLQKFNGKARIIAGGTDLVIDLKTQKEEVIALIDISRIEGLAEIRMDKNRICIGAMVTHAEASKSDLVRQRVPVLSEACSTVGSPQIRNMGTLVGNIVNAMPAADAASALIALGATVRVISWVDQGRIVSVEQLYKGPGESAIDSTREIVTQAEFPVPESRSGSSFQRLSRRKALSLPVLNAAVSIRLDKDLNIFEEARMVVGPVSSTPFRPKQSEALLIGSSVTGEVIQQASETASNEASPRTSLRGGREYRKDMVKVLVERGLRQALIRIHPKFSSFSMNHDIA